MEQQKFAYEKTEHGIRILRCYGNSGCIEIPEEIEGQPVTELAAYAFAKDMDSEPVNTSGLSCICGEALEELYLPYTIRQMGRYLFYNCFQFQKLSFYSNIAFIGAGAFTGCEKLSHLVMHEIKEEKSCLREILSDLKQAVQVKVYLEEKNQEVSRAENPQETQEKEAACQYELVYPEFFEEAEENTPARIINTVTHGMGIQYRNTFHDTRVVFSEYDKLFEIGKYNVDLISGIQLAQARLQYPKELKETSREAYEAFLTGHLIEAAETFLEAGETEKLRWLAECFVTTKEQLEVLWKAAAEQERTEVVSVLMDIGHSRFPEKKKGFSL